MFESLTTTSSGLGSTTIQYDECTFFFPPVGMTKKKEDVTTTNYNTQKTHNTIRKISQLFSCKKDAGIGITWIEGSYFFF